MAEFLDAVQAKTKRGQYVFTVEVVLRHADLADERLEEAADRIREIGSFEIRDVEKLSTQDERRL